MKISTLKRIVRDGLENLYKNKSMTLASIAIVAITVVVFGIFLTMFFNIKEASNELRKMGMIRVFCDENFDDEKIDEIEENISKIDGIMNYRRIDRDEAFREAKDILKDSSVLDGMNEDFLPVSFKINVFDSEDTYNIINNIKKIDGVKEDDIKWSKEGVDFVNNASRMVNFLGIVFIVIFFIVSLGEIMNTIKLTVSARKKEISIMKYVGASDIFVRGPFVVEGVMIGFIGSVIAFFVIGHGYLMLTSRIMNRWPDFRVVLLKDIVNKSLILYILLGSVLGAVGGMFSVQKYLKEYS